MFCVFFLRKERTDRPNAMILFIAKLKYIESDLKEANDLKQTENFRIAVGYRTLSTRFFFFFHLTQSRYSSFCYFKKNGAPMLIMKEKKTISNHVYNVSLNNFVLSVEWGSNDRNFL